MKNRVCEVEGRVSGLGGDTQGGGTGCEIFAYPERGGL